MIPRYRVFDKKRNVMIHEDDLLRIDFEYRVIEYQEIYPLSDGSPERDIYELSFDDCVFMQSTGAYDMDGIEIYKGDILRVQDEDGRVDTVDTGIGVVADCLYMWYVNNVENGLYDLIIDRYIKVIGNIYENPELVEVQNG